MTPETVNVGVEMARLRAYDALRKAHGHDVERMLAAIPQSRAALLASAADDAVVAQRQGCPDCQALPGEACHVDCMSRWDDGGQTVCRHCSRPIVNENGRWVDPEATGDDSVWRETCDSHDTFTAEHEPQR